MDKLKFRRSGIQARVLALTMFFTLGASPVSYTHLDVYKRQALYCSAMYCCG